MELNTVHELPAGRHFAVDERGVLLRVTWRLDRGFVNLSLWRDDRCVETFHLTPGEAAGLIGFLARGLSDATVVAAAATISALSPADPPPRRPAAETVAAACRSLRARLAHDLSQLAARIDPE